MTPINHNDSDSLPPAASATVTDAPQQPPSAGFGTIARQTSRRTTDIMAIAVVLIAGLTFGRQLVEWRRADSKESATAGAAPLPDTPWGAAGSPVAIEFGDQAMSLTRRELTGSRETAVAALVAGCRQKLNNTSSESIASGNPDLAAAERSILDRVADLTPLAEQPGDWRIYRANDPFLMIVGVRPARNPSNADEANTKQQGSRRPHVVCWGMAIPLAENRWTLYLFGAGGNSAAKLAMPVIPLPPESRRLLGLRDQHGGALVGFAGEGSPNRWIHFYEAWFAEQHWRAIEKWQSVGTNWLGRFQAPAPYLGTVEIHIHEEHAGKLLGMQNVLSAEPLIQKRGE